MLLKELFINLCVFSFLVSVAVIFRVFCFPVILMRPARILGGIYAGVVSVVLMNFSIHFKGFLFDLRYIPLILSFVYFGRLAGVITSVCILAGRFGIGGDFSLSFIALLVNTILSLVFSYFSQKFTMLAYQRALFHLSLYSIVYALFLQFNENLRYQWGILFLSFFFTLIGLLLGILLLEGHNTLYSLTNRLSMLNNSLRESQQELMDTIRGQQGAIFKFHEEDGNFILTLCDGQLIRRKQLNPHIFLIPNWEKLLPSDLRPIILSQFEIAWSGREISFELEWPNGKVYLILLQPIVREGETIEVVGSAIDVTEKKRMEKALEESEAQYRLIAENTSDLIAVFRVNGRIKYLSPSHQTMLGYDLEMLWGSSIESLVHIKDLPEVQKAFSQTILEQVASQVEFRIKHADGFWVQLESRCMSVIGAHGDVEHVVVISRDISDRKRTEELLVVSEKLSVVGELAAGVAHEIRNPLTTLKGFIQMFKKGEINPVYLDLMSSELDRIELITNEFLILAKPQVVHYKTKNIIHILNQVTSVLNPQLLLHNISIQEDYVEGLPVLNCEENQLKQVFINMIKNAIEAMPKGGTILIQACKINENIRIRIQDEGCGIPPDLIPRLGEPFYTLKEKGTGLGLMVCNKIIKEHGGTISFQSQVGQGTTVDTFLPIKKGTFV